MKKYSWIVALILALSFTTFFTGCGVDPVEESGGSGGGQVLTTVFDLEDWMEGKAAGTDNVLTLFGDPAAVVNPYPSGTPESPYAPDRALQPLSLAMALTRTPTATGASTPAVSTVVPTNGTVKIVKTTRAGGGKKGIEFAAKADNWVGLDLNYAYMKFKKGDTVKIGGTLIGPSTQFGLNTRISGFRLLGGWGNSKLAIGEFEKTLTLTTEDVEEIKAFKANYDAQVLRIKGNDAYVKFIIDTIVVTGMRDAPFVGVTTIQDVPKIAFVNKELTLKGTVIPFDATDKKITWEVTTAGAGLAVGDGKTGKVTPTEKGTFKVTATIKKGSVDPLDNEAFNEYEQEFSIDVVDAAENIPVNLDGTTGTITTTITPAVLVATSSLAGSPDGKGYIWTRAGANSDYQKDMVFFQIDLGAGKTISSFEKVVFTVTSSNTTYKRAGLALSNNKFTAPVFTGDSDLGNSWGNNGYGTGTQTLTLYINSSEDPNIGTNSYVKGTSNVQKPWISLYVHGNTGDTFTISNIQFFPKP